MSKHQFELLMQRIEQIVIQMVQRFVRLGCPPAQGTADRWGELTEDLVGRTTVPAKANWMRFERNESDSGSRGSWVPVIDSDGQQATFLVIDFILPTNKKIPAGKRIHCEQVARDLWAPDASECPVNA